MNLPDNVSEADIDALTMPDADIDAAAAYERECERADYERDARRDVQAESSESTPLPHMSDELSNTERAAFAATALTAFQQATGCDACDAVADLLANLAHYCDVHGIDYRVEARRAQEFYRDEITPA